jgi:pimeloyl-ACP methyl ester carboxylesterase
MRIVVFILVGILTIAALVLLIDTDEPNIKSTSALSTWKEKAETFNFDKYKISYHDTKSSSQEVILMMHGFPSSSWDWRFLWADLSKNYRLISMDMLGFGLSDKPRDKVYSIQEQADIYETLLEHLAVKNIHILAHDYGDIVTQELLARFNNQEESDYELNIKSVALLNGGIFPELHKELFIQTLLKSQIGPLVSKIAVQPIFNKSFSTVFGSQTKPTEEELDDLWYLVTRQKGHQLNHKLVHYLQDRFAYRERWLGALVSTQVPLLFINGNADPVAGKTTVDKYRDLIPNPNVVELENIGHYPHTEAPDEVIKSYKTFLNTLQ